MNNADKAKAAAALEEAHQNEPGMRCDAAVLVMLATTAVL